MESRPKTVKELRNGAETKRSQLPQRRAFGLKSLAEARKTARETSINDLRGIESLPLGEQNPGPSGLPPLAVTKPKSVAEIQMRLSRYRQEKEFRRIEDQQARRKPFVCGVAPPKLPLADELVRLSSVKKSSQKKAPPKSNLPVLSSSVPVPSRKRLFGPAAVAQKVVEPSNETKSEERDNISPKQLDSGKSEINTKETGYTDTQENIVAKSSVTESKVPKKGELRKPTQLRLKATDKTELKKPSASEFASRNKVELKNIPMAQRQMDQVELRTSDCTTLPRSENVAPLESTAARDSKASAPLAPVSSSPPQPNSLLDRLRNLWPEDLCETESKTNPLERRNTGSECPSVIKANNVTRFGLFGKPPAGTGGSRPERPTSSAANREAQLDVKNKDTVDRKPKSPTGTPHNSVRKSLYRRSVALPRQSTVESEQDISTKTPIVALKSTRDGDSSSIYTVYLKPENSRFLSSVLVNDGLRLGNEISNDRPISKDAATPATATSGVTQTDSVAKTGRRSIYQRSKISLLSGSKCQSGISDMTPSVKAIQTPLANGWKGQKVQPTEYSSLNQRFKTQFDLVKATPSEKVSDDTNRRRSNSRRSCCRSQQNEAKSPLQISGSEISTKKADNSVTNETEALTDESRRRNSNPCLSDHLRQTEAKSSLRVSDVITETGPPNEIIEENSCDQNPITRVDHPNETPVGKVLANDQCRRSSSPLLSYELWDSEAKSPLQMSGSMCATETAETVLTNKTETLIDENRRRSSSPCSSYPVQQIEAKSLLHVSDVVAETVPSNEIIEENSCDQNLITHIDHPNETPAGKALTNEKYRRSSGRRSSHLFPQRVTKNMVKPTTAKKTAETEQPKTSGGSLAMSMRRRSAAYSPYVIDSKSVRKSLATPAEKALWTPGPVDTADKVVRRNSIYRRRSRQSLAINELKLDESVSTPKKIIPETPQTDVDGTPYLVDPASSIRRSNRSTKYCGSFKDQLGIRKSPGVNLDISFASSSVPAKKFALSPETTTSEASEAAPSDISNLIVLDSNPVEDIFGIKIRFVDDESEDENRKAKGAPGRSSGRKSTPKRFSKGRPRILSPPSGKLMTPPACTKVPTVVFDKPYQTPASILRKDVNRNVIRDSERKVRFCKPVDDSDSDDGKENVNLQKELSFLFCRRSIYPSRDNLMEFTP